MRIMALPQVTCLQSALSTCQPELNTYVVLFLYYCLLQFNEFTKANITSTFCCASSTFTKSLSPMHSTHRHKYTPTHIYRHTAIEECYLATFFILSLKNKLKHITLASPANPTNQSTSQPTIEISSLILCN